jgi:hypothetical protein
VGVTSGTTPQNGPSSTPSSRLAGPLKTSKPSLRPCRRARGTVVRVGLGRPVERSLPFAVADDPSELLLGDEPRGLLTEW